MLIDGTTFTSPIDTSFMANASTQYKSTQDTFFNDATIKDYSGWHTIDNSSYHLLLYDGTSVKMAQVKVIGSFIQQVVTVIEMTSGQVYY